MMDLIIETVNSFWFSRRVLFGVGIIGIVIALTKLRSAGRIGIGSQYWIAYSYIAAVVGFGLVANAALYPFQLDVSLLTAGISCFLIFLSALLWLYVGICAAKGDAYGFFAMSMLPFAFVWLVPIGFYNLYFGIKKGRVFEGMKRDLLRTKDSINRKSGTIVLLKIAVTCAVIVFVFGIMFILSFGVLAAMPIIGMIEMSIARMGWIHLGIPLVSNILLCIGLGLLAGRWTLSRIVAYRKECPNENQQGRI